MCSIGDSEAGTAVLDVGTEDVDTELTSFDGSHWLSADNKRGSSLRCDWLAVERRRARHERLERMNAINTRRCDQYVVHGSDTHSVVDCLSTSALSSWGSIGYVHCLEAQFGSHLQQRSVYWQQTDALKRVSCTPEHHLERLRDVLDRYVLFGICYSVQRYACCSCRNILSSDILKMLV